MLKLFDEMVCVQESSVPRPHYRVTMKAAVPGHPDLLPGLLRDEVTMTVCLPIDIGTDIEVVKRAATSRLALLAAKLADYPSGKKQDNGVAFENGVTIAKDSKTIHRSGSEQ